MPIEEGSPPPTEQGEQVIEGAIEIINGIPTRTFTVERLPDDALARLVNRERDRRKSGGFDFTVRGTSYRFQSDPISLQNISGAVQMASLAIAAGATAGNLQWDGSGEDFGWTVEDNSVVALDPFEMIAFGQFAAAHVARAHKRARQIKNMTPVPTGFDADSYWS